MKYVLLTMTVCVTLLWAPGCATTVTSQNPQPANRSQVFAYTPEDIDRAVEVWIDDLVKFGPVASSATPPMVGFCNIANRGGDPTLDMVQFQRAFEYFAVRQGKIKLTSATNLPDKFFDNIKIQKSAIADKDTAAKIGKMQGWKYVIYGDLFEKLEHDAKGHALKYYDVYIYMTDLETLEQVWNSRQKFVLNRNKPTVGW